MTDQAAVLETNAAFYRAFEKKDLEAMAAVWSQGSASVCVHPGRDVLRGWEQVKTSWTGIFRNTKYLEIDTTVIKVEVTGSLAYVVLVETVLQVAGGRQNRATSIATNIFEYMGDRWYLVHHHGSPVMS